MHEIKEIRKDPEKFLKKINERKSKVDLKNLLELDKKNRELIQTKEKFEQEKKIISQKKDKSQFAKSKEISTDIEKVSKDQIQIKDKIDLILSSLPNLALDDVPVGKDENSNKEISKSGKITKLDFRPLSHYELGKKTNQMNFDIASKTSGARFVFLNDKLALLERSISNFM